MQQMPDEGQAAGFAAQRAAADLQEEGVGGLKGCRIELADEGLALLAPVFRDGGNQVVAQVFVGAKVSDLARPQLLRQGEFGARHQPMREVVALAVVGEAFLRNRMQQGLQRIQVGGAADLGLADRAGER